MQPTPQPGNGPNATELLLTELAADPDVQYIAPGGVHGSAVNFDQQAAGCIGLAEGGLVSVQPYVPLMDARVALKVHALTQAHGGAIAGVLRQKLDKKLRRVVEQPSTGERFLVHWSRITGGPNLAFETEKVWVELVYVETLIGTEAVAP